MKAAVCREYGKPLTIEEVVLRAPGVGEVEVAIHAVAICHSDILYAEGAWPAYLPAVYGHEAAGRITALGEGVTGYAVGDAVVVSLIRACGQCRACKLGRPTACTGGYNRTNGVLTLPDGTVVEQGMNTAAFAERAVVHSSQIAPVPEGVSMDAASLLACGVITGAGAVINTAQVPAGAHVVVIGAGGVGLNAVQAARITGAQSVIAVDITDEKLTAARDFGATHALRADKVNLRKEVMQITEQQGADFVFVTVGAIAAYQGAGELTGRGGQVVMVGMPPSGATITVEPVMVAALGQSFLGSNMGSAVLARDIPYLANLYRQGRLKLDELITRRYSLDQINEAIEDTKAGQALRNVIVINHETA